jgi:hypothetical protein
MIVSHVTESVHRPALVLPIFRIVESVWQSILQMTDDSAILRSCLRVARACVQVSVDLREKNPSQCIVSTICGLVVSTSAGFPLAPQGVVALPSIVRLLKKFNAHISDF